MSCKVDKKIRREYKKAMAERAKKDNAAMHTYLVNKSPVFRFKLAMKILFRIGVKKGKNESKG